MYSETSYLDHTDTITPKVCWCRNATKSKQLYNINFIICNIHLEISLKYITFA